MRAQARNPDYTLDYDNVIVLEVVLDTMEKALARDNQGPKGIDLGVSSQDATN